MPIAPPFDWHGAFVKPAAGSLQVGAISGVAGLTGGAAAGLWISSRPGIYAGAAGLQCFYYGASTFFLRSLFLANKQAERTKRAELMASGGAGLISGALAGALQSRPGSILRSGILVGFLAVGSQAGYHFFSDIYRQPEQSSSLLDRLSKRGWFPLRKLSDSEYEGMLKEHIIKLEAEIAIVDEQLMRLRKERDAIDTQSDPMSPKG